MSYAAEIKSRLTLPEILQRYGFKLNRQNRMPCPFHSGHHDNFGVKDDFYHCFVCGCSGDMISFVQNYFDLSYPGTIEKINDDFSLNLPIGRKRTDRERLADAKSAFMRKREMESKIAEGVRLEEEYWAAFERWKILYDNKIKYAPKSADEDFNPLFVEAAKEIDDAAYTLECAEIRRQQYANAGKNPGIHGR